MSFFSDYSSDEEPEEEVDLWNPNSLIDEIQTVQKEEEKAMLRQKLVDTFLEQQRPILTQKMKLFMMQDDVLEIFLRYVSRNKEENSGSSTDKSFSKSEKPIYRDLNPEGNEELVRKSFNVMAIFLNPMNDLDELIHTHLKKIVHEIFRTLSPASCGNLYHFAKIFEQLLVREPVETTNAIIDFGLIWKLFDHLHETPIVDTLIGLFCCTFPSQNHTIAFYKSLIDAKLLEVIGERIYGKDQPYAQFAGEFFIRLLDKLSSHELSGILFISLCRTPFFINGLFSAILASETPAIQKQTCVRVLRDLLFKSSEKMYEQADFSRPLPNMLSAIHDKLHQYAKCFVPDLCNLLIEIEGKKWENPVLSLPSFSVRRPLGLYTFSLLEILSDLIATTPDVLINVPPQTWRVLLSWFIEFSHNNLYHGLFYRIFWTLIRFNQPETLKVLLVKYKFLSRILEHYKSTDSSSSRGYILQMCNVLRLAADLQPSGLILRQYLASHDQWKQLLPIIRIDTLLQIKKYSDISSSEEDVEGEGIDLGSPYALSLGFEEMPPTILTPTSSPNSKNRKKNKKKKKKKASNIVGVNGIEKKFEQVFSGNEANEPVTSTDQQQQQEQQEQQEQQQQLDWWKTLKEDFAKKEPKSELDSSSWWKDLKEELNQLSSTSTSTSSPVYNINADVGGSIANEKDRDSWWKELKSELETKTD